MFLCLYTITITFLTTGSTKSSEATTPLASLCLMKDIMENTSIIHLYLKTKQVPWEIKIHYVTYDLENLSNVKVTLCMEKSEKIFKSLMRLVMVRWWRWFNDVQLDKWTGWVICGIIWNLLRILQFLEKVMR